jgi:large subunit ribosomal protein L5e
MGFVKLLKTNAYFKRF